MADNDLKTTDGILIKVPYNADLEQISFVTLADTVIIDGMPLPEYLKKTPETNTITEKFLGLLTLYTVVSDKLNNINAVKALSESVWNNNSPAVSDTLPHLWKRFRELYEKENITRSRLWNYEFCGSRGEPGIDGAWREWIFKIDDENADEDELTKEVNALYSTAVTSAYLKNDYVPTYWDDDMLLVTKDGDALWCATRDKENKLWLPFKNIHKFVVKPKDADNAFVNLIYTSTKENEDIVTEKWNSDKEILIENIKYKEGSTVIPGNLDTNYKWYDYIDDAEFDPVVYQATCYFVNETCINIDAPIRITGPAGAGSDSFENEFIYCSSNYLDTEQLPSFVGNEKPLQGNTGNLGWYDNAYACAITSDVRYLFYRTRLGHYFDDNNWYWKCGNYYYGKNQNNRITSVAVIDSTKAPTGWNYGWSEPKLWASWGQDGKDGDGVQYVFLRITLEEYDWVTENGWKFDGESRDNGKPETSLAYEEFPASIINGTTRYWADDPCKDDQDEDLNDCTGALDAEHPYIFCTKRLFKFDDEEDFEEDGTLKAGKNKHWGDWETPLLWSHYGQDAKGYRLNLENFNESFYYLKGSNASGNFVIIDADGVSTGLITLESTEVISDTIPIDTIKIGTSSDSLIDFDSNNLVTIESKDDGWECQFRKTQLSNGYRIDLIKVGTASALNKTQYLDVLKAPYTPGDDDKVFNVTLTKFLKKFVIWAQNSKQGVTKTALWTLNSIRDRNNDGIFRYALSANSNRITMTETFNLESAGTLLKNGNPVYSVSDAFPFKFYVKFDTYGNPYSDYTGPIEIKICDPKGNYLKNIITTKTNGNYLLDEADAINMLSDISKGTNPQSQLSAAKAELWVIDPDYDPNFNEDTYDKNTYNTYSKVDEMTIYLDYIKIINGKNGKDGKDGSNGKSVILNLSNDEGKFGFMPKKGNTPPSAKLSDLDHSTDIEYIVEGSYKLISEVIINGIKYEETKRNITYNGLTFDLIKSPDHNNKVWKLDITYINASEILSQYNTSGVLPKSLELPMTFTLDGNTLGTLTFKMNCVSDRNYTGIYDYTLDSSLKYVRPGMSESLSIDVTKSMIYPPDNLYQEDDTSVILKIIYKDDTPPDILTTYNTLNTKTSERITVPGGITGDDIQQHKGVIIECYTDDNDYSANRSLGGDYPNYYYAGESEEIAHTALDGESAKPSQEDILKASKTISCNNDNIIIIPSKEYTFVFKNASDDPLEVTLSNIPKQYFGNVTTISANSNGEIKLKANDLLEGEQNSGSMHYECAGYIAGDINWTYIGDLNLDSTYHGYDIIASNLVLGYGDNGNLEIDTILVDFVHTVSKDGAINTYYISNNDGIYTINDGEPILFTSNGKGEQIKIPSGNKSFIIYLYVKSDGDNDLSINPITKTYNNTKYYLADSETIDVVPTVAINGTVYQTQQRLGQACRIRNIDSINFGSGCYCFPIGVESDKDLPDTIEGTKDTATKIYIPKYYDVISKFTPPNKVPETATDNLKKNGFTTYYLKIGQIETYPSKDDLERDLSNEDSWSATEMQDFMAIDTLISNQIDAKVVSADKILIKAQDSEDKDPYYTAGMLSPDTYRDAGVALNSRDVVLFSGRADGTGLEKSKFYVTKSGEAHIEGSIAASTFEVTKGSSLSTSFDPEKSCMWITTRANIEAATQDPYSALHDKTITGYAKDISMDAPLILISAPNQKEEGKYDFFVLNPLQLREGGNINYSFLKGNDFEKVNLGIEADTYDTESYYKFLGCNGYLNMLKNSEIIGKVSPEVSIILDNNKEQKILNNLEAKNLILTTQPIISYDTSHLSNGELKAAGYLTVSNKEWYYVNRTPDTLYYMCRVSNANYYETGGQSLITICPGIATIYKVTNGKSEEIKKSYFTKIGNNICTLNVSTTTLHLSGTPATYTTYNYEGTLISPVLNITKDIGSFYCFELNRIVLNFDDYDATLTEFDTEKMASASTINKKLHT